MAGMVCRTGRRYCACPGTGIGTGRHGSLLPAAPCRGRGHTGGRAAPARGRDPHAGRGPRRRARAPARVGPRPGRDGANDRLGVRRRGGAGPGRGGQHRPGAGRPLDAKVLHPGDRGARPHAAHGQDPVLHRHHFGAGVPARSGDEDDEGRVPAASPRWRGRAGQPLLRGPVVPRRRHGDRDGRHRRPARGTRHDLPVRPRQRNLAPERADAARALVPDAGAARGWAHSRDRRPRRAGRAHTSTRRSRATRRASTSSRC